MMKLRQTYGGKIVVSAAPASALLTVMPVVADWVYLIHVLKLV